MSDTGAPILQTPPRRTRTPSAFKQDDVTRAVKGVLAAGLAVVGAKIARDGDITVLAEVKQLEVANPYDAWKASNGSR
jgi:hypothetical protein